MSQLGSNQNAPTASVPENQTIFKKMQEFNQYFKDLKEEKFGLVFKGNSLSEVVNDSTFMSKVQVPKTGEQKGATESLKDNLLQRHADTYQQLKALEKNVYNATYASEGNKEKERAQVEQDYLKFIQLANKFREDLYLANLQYITNRYKFSGSLKDVLGNLTKHLNQFLDIKQPSGDMGLKEPNYRAGVNLNNALREGLTWAYQEHLKPNGQETEEMHKKLDHCDVIFFWQNGFTSGTPSISFAALKPSAHSTDPHDPKMAITLKAVLELDKQDIGKGINDRIVALSGSVTQTASKEDKKAAVRSSPLHVGEQKDISNPKQKANEANIASLKRLQPKKP